MLEYFLSMADGTTQKVQNPLGVPREIDATKMWMKLRSSWYGCYRYRIKQMPQIGGHAIEECNDNETGEGLTTKENETSHIVFRGVLKVARPLTRRLE